MLLTMKPLLPILLAFVLPLFGSGQEIDLKYLGNCAYRIRLDSVEIFTDFPYQPGAYGYMTFDIDSAGLDKPNQYLLFTHKHKDHYWGKMVRKSGLKKFTPFLPNGKKKKLLRELAGKHGIVIKSFKTRHRYSFKHRSLAIEWKGKKIFIFGDTEREFPGYLNSDTLDLVFACGWQVPQLQAQNHDYRFRNVVVYHLRQQESGNRELIVPFLDKHLGFMSVKPRYVILKQYESTTIKR